MGASLSPSLMRLDLSQVWGAVHTCTDSHHVTWERPSQSILDYLKLFSPASRTISWLQNHAGDDVPLTHLVDGYEASAAAQRPTPHHPATGPSVSGLMTSVGGKSTLAPWFPHIPASSIGACAAPSVPPRSVLRQLDLSFNWIQDNAASWLLLALGLFPQLTHLHLNHNSYSGPPMSPLSMSRQSSDISPRGGLNGGKMSNSKLLMKVLDTNEQVRVSGVRRGWVLRVESH